GSPSPPSTVMVFVPVAVNFMIHNSSVGNDRGDCYVTALIWRLPGFFCFFRSFIFSSCHRPIILYSHSFLLQRSTRHCCCARSRMSAFRRVLKGRRSCCRCSFDPPGSFFSSPTPE